MAEKTVNDLFLHGLKDIYYAENQILKALPEMADAAGTPELAEAFRTHQAQTEGQIDRLKKVFAVLGQKPQGVECKAILGIIEEGNEMMDEFAEGEAADLALVSAAQAVEHYEIARYATLMSLAEQLGLDEAVDLLEANFDEEVATDELLADLADGADPSDFAEELAAGREGAATQ